MDAFPNLDDNFFMTYQIGATMYGLQIVHALTDLTYVLGWSYTLSGIWDTPTAMVAIAGLSSDLKFSFRAKQIGTTNYDYCMIRSDPWAGFTMWEACLG